MPQLVYKPGQRRHLYAVRQLVADPKHEDCYVAGQLVAVYASNDAESVIRQVGDLVPPPYAVIHVTGYMLAIAHQGQEGFRVRIVEPDGEHHEQYIVSLIDMVRAGWTIPKMR
jgi:hypothetical protein